jgi:hypothetical protein
MPEPSASAKGAADEQTKTRLIHVEKGTPRSVVEGWQRLAKQDSKPN